MNGYRERTTTRGLALTIAAVFLAAAGVVSLITGFGGTEGQVIGLGIALLVLAAIAGIGAALQR